MGLVCFTVPWCDLNATYHLLWCQLELTGCKNWATGMKLLVLEKARRQCLDENQLSSQWLWAFWSCLLCHHGIGGWHETAFHIFFVKLQIYLEDAGFDWKILGPDVSSLKYVAWVCDQDAYAFSGQKCSAQSLLVMHENWVKAGLVEAIKERASHRKLEDLTACPVLTWTTDRMMQHVEKLLKIPGIGALGTSSWQFVRLGYRCLHSLQCSHCCM